jgi:hypothetical protein
MEEQLFYWTAISAIDQTLSPFSCNDSETTAVITTNIGIQLAHVANYYWLNTLICQPCCFHSARHCFAHAAMTVIGAAQ